MILTGLPYLRCFSNAIGRGGFESGRRGSPGGGASQHPGFLDFEQLQKSLSRRKEIL